MKRLLTILAAVTLVSVYGVGAANAQAGQKEFKLPRGAVQLADGSYYLGKKTDPTTGKVVEGIAFLHPKNQAAKAFGVTNKGGTVCYAFLARGLKWKSVEDWKLDPANSQSLGSNFLLTNTASNLNKWETASGTNIFGTGSLASGLSADEVTPDGQNEVMFGAIDSPGTIAVTIVWGYYSGPTQSREIVEWDQIFDDQDFSWSNSGTDPTSMDFENISTHEVGHAAGMGHPSDTCSEETMYRYGTEGETKKRDLNAGDIAGIRALY